MVQEESIPLDDIDYSELEKKYTITEDSYLDNILVIDQLPKTDQRKEKKLFSLLNKNLFKEEFSLTTENVWAPRDPETGLGKGFIFVDVETPERLARVSDLVNGYILDAHHKFISFPYSELGRLSLRDEPVFSYTPGEYQEREYYKNWLYDEESRDQFYVNFGGNAQNVGFYWAEKKGPATEIKTYERVAEHITWSPLGTYLAEFHPQGILVKFGLGNELQMIRKINHYRVNFIDFSPRETYIVTWSKDPIPGQSNNTFIYEILSGKLIFSCYLPPPETNQDKVFWPLVKWTFNETFFAYSQGNLLFIYHFTSNEESVINYEIKLLDKKPLQIESLQDFSFAPRKAPLLAYWTLEKGNTPTKVVVLELPSLKLIKSKNYFKAIGCSLFWQNEANYLAIRVEKSRKLTTFEFFKLNEKDVPVEILEVKGTWNGIFEWEPCGHRFGFTETAPGESKYPIFHFYDMRGKDNSIMLIKSFERKNINKFFWSPKGNFLVFAGLADTSGQLEFWSFNENPSEAGEKLECIRASEHFLLTDVEWDPSGRFVITYASYTKTQTENNYMIWDFKGALITKCTSLPKLKELKWRPRTSPEKSLLSAEQVKDIKHNLKAYSKVFDEEDKKKSLESLSTAQTLKLKLKEDWKAWKSRARKEWNLSEKKSAVVTSQSGDQVVQEWMEEVVEEIEELIP